MINLLILVGLCIISGSLSDVFFTASNLFNIGEQISVVVIILCPFTLLMVSGEFDLSVGSVVALSGVVAAMLARAGIAVEISFFLGALVGLLVGAINAAMAVGLGINSFIATIGTMYAARGAALLLSRGTQISNVPYNFSDFGNFMVGKASIMIFIWVAIVIIFTLIQRYTSLGRYSVASGSSAEASFLAGVPVKRTKVICYLLTGFAAGFAGILRASQLGSGSPTSADGLEFQVIVAAVVGGASLKGGEGDMVTSLLGAIIIGVLNNMLNLNAVESYWQKVSLGLILVAMVAVDIIISKRDVGKFLNRCSIKSRAKI